MKRWVVGLVLALVAALFGGPTAAADSTARHIVATHTYDSHSRSVSLTSTTEERGPPATTYDHAHTRKAAAVGARVVSPLRFEAAAWTYGAPAAPAQVARVAGATLGGADARAEVLSAPPGKRAAANKGPSTLFHYTDEAGQRGILESGQLNPSLKSMSPKDARYGDGQYLSDIAPGSRTCAQLSACFLNVPFQGRKFANYVEIDVSGLNIVKGRDGVFVNPSGVPLDISRRLVSSGTN